MLYLWTFHSCSNLGFPALAKHVWVCECKQSMDTLVNGRKDHNKMCLEILMIGSSNDKPYRGKHWRVSIQTMKKNSKKEMELIQLQVVDFPHHRYKKDGAPLFPIFPHTQSQTLVLTQALCHRSGFWSYISMVSSILGCSHWKSKQVLSCIKSLCGVFPDFWKGLFFACRCLRATSMALGSFSIVGACVLVQGRFLHGSCLNFTSSVCPMDSFCIADA